MARPFEKFPPGARQHLETMAAHGLLSESAAANSIGIPLDQFRQIIRDHPRSKEIWETALAIERDELLKALYTKAVGGDVSAAKALLATRHGMSERQPQSSPGVNITFNLPVAMKPDDYEKLVEIETKKALMND